MGQPADMPNEEHYGRWPAFPSNPRGQYEDDDFVQIFEKVFGNWRSPDIHGFSFPFYREDLSRLVVNKCSANEGKTWGVKSPQLCYAAGVLVECLQRNDTEVKVVLVNRVWQDIVKSLMLRDDFIKPIAEHILATYTVALYNTLGTLGNLGVEILDLKYENVMENKAKNVQRIADFALGATVTPQVEAMSFLNDDLWHNKG